MMTRFRSILIRSSAASTSERNVIEIEGKVKASICLYECRYSTHAIANGAMADF